jgi:phospholipid/cholesterol/gamma-HCH transport system substrate-binding protein
VTPLAGGVRLVAALAVAQAVLSGCGPGLQDLPLPGSGAHGDSYRLEAVFDDAVNLTEGAQIKIDGLPVGRVQEIDARGFKAVAQLDIESDIVVPVGSTARLRYDTPLGELFVQLDTPNSGTALREGDSIPAKDTSSAPSVEDTLAQASLLVNGGGLTELQAINHELNTALGGRENLARDVLERATVLLRGANASSTDLDRLLRDLNTTAATLKERREVFGEALRELGPLADILRSDTPALNRLLRKTGDITRQANRVLDQTRTQTTQILRQLAPILDEVLSAEPAFVHGLTALQRADEVLKKTIPGDFIGLDAIIRLDLAGLLNPAPDQAATPPGGEGLGGMLDPLTGLFGGRAGLPVGDDPLLDLLSGVPGYEPDGAR